MTSNSYTPVHSKSDGDAEDILRAANEKTVPTSKSVTTGLRLGQMLIDLDNDRSSTSTSVEWQHESSPVLSNAASGSLTPEKVGQASTESEVEAAIIRCVNECLRVSPKALDFAVVKQMVERQLGLTPDFWGKNECDEWYTKSKNINKMAVVRSCNCYLSGFC